MRMIWSSDGIRIFDIATATFKDGSAELWVRGIGDIHQPMIGSRAFQWDAIPIQNGWLVEIHTSSGQGGSFQGSTFNLALEVATAARRLL